MLHEFSVPEERIIQSVEETLKSRELSDSHPPAGRQICWTEEIDPGAKNIPWEDVGLSLVSGSASTFVPVKGFQIKRKMNNLFIH